MNKVKQPDNSLICEQYEAYLKECGGFTQDMLDTILSDLLEKRQDYKYKEALETEVKRISETGDLQDFHQWNVKPELKEIE